MRVHLRMQPGSHTTYQTAASLAALALFLAACHAAFRGIQDTSTNWQGGDGQATDSDLTCQGNSIEELVQQLKESNDEFSDDAYC